MHEAGPVPVAVTHETAWPPADLTWAQLFLDAVDHAGWAPGVRHHETKVVAVDVPAVHVAAGLAEDRDGDHHPRTGDEPALDRGLDAEVGPAGVADGCHSGVEEASEHYRRLEELHRERPTLDAEQIHAIEDRVDVAVDEPGRDEHAADVDVLIAVRRFPGGGDRDDPVAVNDDVRVERVCSGSVEDSPTTQDDPGHATGSSMGR